MENPARHPEEFGCSFLQHAYSVLSDFFESVSQIGPFDSLVARFPPHLLEPLSSILFKSGLTVGATTYVSASISLAAFAVLFSFLLLLSFFSDPWFCLELSLAVGFAVSLVLAFLPSYLCQKRAVELERLLPLTLSSMALELDLGIPFEQVLAHAGQGEGGLAREFRTVADDVFVHACSVPGALRACAQRSISVQLSRACAQLSFVYSNGSGASDLRQYAQGLVALQAQQLHRFHSKMALAGIVFLVFSSLVPAFFSSAVALGDLLGWSFSTNDIFIAYGFVFPFLDLALLLYVYEKTPKVLNL